MELGEKILQARLEAGLSQRQLCGGEITRNMLSQIEHGTASPSMKTLRYLAGQLGKPVSWFLGETTEAESRLLESEELLQKAREAIEEEKYIYAEQLLEKITHPAAAIQREKLLLLARIPGKAAEEICAQLPSLDEELLLRARGALEAGNWMRCANLLGAVENQNKAEWNLLQGRLLLLRKDYTGAAAHLHRAEEAYPEAVPALLEACYRELGDYKLAYEYACRQKK